MTNIEKILKQDIEKFADVCANICCFRGDKLNTLSPYLCDDCEFGNYNKTCNKIALKRYLLSESTDALNVLTEVRDKVRALPSVIPQQKVGKWIRVDKDKLKCSECEIIHFIAQYTRSANINYCPNCGAKMEVEE